MIDIAQLWRGVAWELWQDVGTVVVVNSLQLYTAEQLVLGTQIVIQPAGVVVLLAVNRRVKDEPVGIQAIAKRRVITRWIAGIHEREKVGVRSDSQRIEGLQLRCRGGLHVAVHIDVVQLAGPKRSVRNDL